MVLPSNPHLQSGQEDFLPATEEIGKWRQKCDTSGTFFCSRQPELANQEAALRR